MDLIQLLNGTLLSTVLGLVVIILLWKNWVKQNSNGRLPPGPTPLPLLGNLLQMGLKEPYKFYLELSKKYGSVFTIWYGSKPVVVVSGYQALKDALVNQGEAFSGRANYPMLMMSTKGYGVMVSSGQRWKELRRFSIMTLKNFGMGRRGLEERVQEEAKRLVKAFSEQGDCAFNPKEVLSKTVSNVICSIVFGQRFEYNDPTFQLLYDAVEKYFQVLSSPLGQMYNMFPRLVSFFPGKHHDMFALLEKAQVCVRTEAEKRLKILDTSADPQDFIEAFLIQMVEEKGQPNSEFHYDNMLMTVWNLFSAGTETTSSTLRYTLLLMLRHPDVQEKVQKEIDEVIGSSRVPSMEDKLKMPYTEAVLHEIQRSMDIAPTSIPHKVIKDTEFQGYYIPENTMVLPLLSSVLCDPKLWKNPEVFDPENFLDENGRFMKNEAFLPFGLGKRVCLGEGLARMELFLFFTSLLQRFTFRGTKSPEEIDTSPESCSFGRRTRSFNCYVIPRQ